MEGLGMSKMRAGIKWVGLDRLCEERLEYILRGETGIKNTSLENQKRRRSSQQGAAGLI